jgi:hypothetical protein
MNSKSGGVCHKPLLLIALTSSLLSVGRAAEVYEPPKKAMLLLHPVQSLKGQLSPDPRITTADAKASR